MKVFLTGGSGLIGSTALPLLVAAGHQVTALARSDPSAERARSLGATQIVRGTLDDLDTLGKAASEAEAVIHMAYDHDMAWRADGIEEAAAKDRKVIETLAAHLPRGAYLITASGTFSNAGPEETSGKGDQFKSGRGATEVFVKSLVADGLKPYVVRFAPVVHNHDRAHPFLEAQIAKAKEVGWAGYVGDGSNVWPAAHVKDVAALLVLLLQPDCGAPPGSTLHAIAEEGVSTGAISELIGTKLNVETRSVKAQDAPGHWGIIGRLLTLDNPTTNALTKGWTGWQPKEIGLLEEIEQHYSFE